MVRVGVDLVQTERVERLLAEHPAAAAELFTAGEVAYCSRKRRPHEHLAARFAAKEAVLKAVGTGLGRQMNWTDVEIVTTPIGRPRVRLAGTVAEAAERRGITEVDVSLTHSGGLALASAVAFGPGRGGHA